MNLVHSWWWRLQHCGPDSLNGCFLDWQRCFIREEVCFVIEFAATQPTKMVRSMLIGLDTPRLIPRQRINECDSKTVVVSRFRAFPLNAYRAQVLLACDGQGPGFNGLFSPAGSDGGWGRSGGEWNPIWKGQGLLNSAWFKPFSTSKNVGCEWMNEWMNEWRTLSTFLCILVLFTNWGQIGRLGSVEDGSDTREEGNFPRVHLSYPRNLAATKHNTQLQMGHHMKELIC